MSEDREIDIEPSIETPKKRDPHKLESYLDEREQHQLSDYPKEFETKKTHLEEVQPPLATDLDFLHWPRERRSGEPMGAFISNTEIAIKTLLELLCQTDKTFEARYLKVINGRIEADLAKQTEEDLRMLIAEYQGNITDIYNRAFRKLTTLLKSEVAMENLSFKEAERITEKADKERAQKIQDKLQEAGIL